MDKNILLSSGENNVEKLFFTIVKIILNLRIKEAIIKIMDKMDKNILPSSG